MNNLRLPLAVSYSLNKALIGSIPSPSVGIFSILGASVYEAKILRQ